ncbi:hypothetical protein [Pseudooceanicola sp. 200-1SW]|uniref:hypothetical protein n=1 Tax=Pseudooceanicola sp. 200-1SW TaxID=3425949 RepID=UPI003D7FA024
MTHSFKSALCAGLFLLAGLTAGASTVGAEERPLVMPPEAGPERILFIGNSYLYYGDGLQNHARRMAAAAYPDRKFNYKLAAIAGGYMDEQPVAQFLTLGGEQGYDLVVLQGNSGAMLSEEKRARFGGASETAAGLIAETGAATALYMTPAYGEGHARHDPQMTGLISDGYTAEGNRLGALVIPVGRAFALAYERRPEIALHQRDHSHPTKLGTYLGAATLYATLYDVSAVGNTYDMYGEISTEDAAFLQQVAEDAVAEFYAQ